MVCKNIVENFVTIALLSKELMILLRGQSVNLWNKIAKINTYIYIYIYILIFKKKN